MSNRTFQNTGSIRPGRSAFDLSHVKLMTADMGILYPVLVEECVPGDVFSHLGNQAVVRMMPLVAPILHQIDLKVEYFFVPYRLLWNARTREDLTEIGDWEDFITGGEDGSNNDTIPTWNPTDYTVGSLWDYLGFPPTIDCAGAYPIDFPRRAYNLIWHDYYRDINLQNVDGAPDWENEDLLLRNWEKDYFTSSLPWQQRGTAPALPISGTTSAVWPLQVAVSQVTMYQNSATNVPYDAVTKATLENNTIDLSSATTFDVADLRLAFQVQKWMERNARSGARYTSFLKSHFAVSPRDDRMMRPEWLGSTKAPIIISEVLQTSETNTTPQGTLSGHGITVSQNSVQKYKVEEFGLIMALMSIMPKPIYQQGINRQWLRESKYDFYFPEFANLSEQAVINAELCCKDADATHNTTLFGYQGRYDEMRVKQNSVHGLMRTTFDYWHLSRQFAPGSEPSLNSDFIECDPRDDAWATPSEPQMVVEFGNIIKAFRPLPVTAEPGLIDHN